MDIRNEFSVPIYPTLDTSDAHIVKNGKNSHFGCQIGVFDVKSVGMHVTDSPIIQ